MKKLLILLAVCLTAAVSCDFDYDLRIDASAELYYANGDVLKTGVVTYSGGYHTRKLYDYQLDRIFKDLTQHASLDFNSAKMHVEVTNMIGNQYLGAADYGVVYSSFLESYEFTEFLSTY